MSQNEAVGISERMLPCTVCGGCVRGFFNSPCAKAGGADPDNPPRAHVTEATFALLRAANVQRQREWDADNKVTLSYRGNEFAGEAGEVCNVVKKLDRERLARYDRTSRRGTGRRYHLC